MEELINNPVSAYAWLLNGMSLMGAYCLANQKVTIGRVIAATAALGWFFYGYLISEPSFMIANVIFCYIYVSAIRKFRSKQDGYKAENKALTKANVKLLKRINAEHSESADVIDNMILRGQKQVAALELLRDSMNEVDKVA